MNHILNVYVVFVFHYIFIAHVDMNMLEINLVITCHMLELFVRGMQIQILTSNMDYLRKRWKLSKKIVEEKKQSGSQLICSLVFDEVAIRKNVQWCDQEKTYLGYVTCGQTEEGEELDEIPMERQAILFMLNAINERFQMPIAYYFINSLNSDQRVELLNLIMATLTEHGIRISNVTFDGFSANSKMCRDLGANLELDDGIFHPYFLNPVDNKRIDIIFDACHMLKLIRNTFAKRRVIFDGNGNQIEWVYIERLYRFTRENFQMTHKITKKTYPVGSAYNERTDCRRDTQFRCCRFNGIPHESRLS